MNRRLLSFLIKSLRWGFFKKGMAMARKMVKTIVVGLLFGASMGFGMGETVSSEGVSSAPASSQDTQGVVAADTNSGILPAEASEIQKPIQNKPSLFFALDEGQIMRGLKISKTKYSSMSRVWQQRLYLNIANTMTYRERLRLIVSFECQLTFSYDQVTTYPGSLVPQFSFYPNDAEINYTFGNLQKPWLHCAIGYFPFKYNPDAKHLGEYLLRSNAYPTFIVNNFEFPVSRELGLHVSGKSDWLIDPAIDRIKWDLLFTSETHAYSWPTQDWTLTAVVSNSLFNFLDIGAGVSWQRLFPVNDTVTTPRNPKNRYFGEGGIADTNYISFKATKLMGRASINPQRFIPEFKIPFWPIFGETPFFGKQDLKLYGEIAVLGLDNYMAYDSVIVDSVSRTKAWMPASKVPVNNYARYYDSIQDRMPYIIGINLPTQPIISYGILPILLTQWLYDETGDDIRALSLITLFPALASGVASHYLGWNFALDEFSLEFEWASQRFPNSNLNSVDFSTGGVVPIPMDVQYRNKVVTPMQVKYALYFKKSFMNKRFAFSGLIARDHMRPAFHGPEFVGATDDVLQGKNHWWWALRLSANF
jgi:hypothetical protein